MKSHRNKFADLYAMHFLGQGFTQESCHNRVDNQNPVVGILIQSNFIRGRLPNQTIFLKYFVYLDGGGPRLSQVVASQKPGDWKAGVGDKVLYYICCNTT